LAEQTPYNEKVIERLMDFDYTGFMAKHGLNSIIFKDVQTFLSNGNITGMYKHIHSKFNSIISILYSLRAETSEQIISINYIWILNELSHNTLIFGQYTARCFNEILN
jgi:hypothetical protein